MIPSLPFPSLKKQRTEIPSSSGEYDTQTVGRWTFHRSRSGALFKYKLRIRNAKQIVAVGKSSADHHHHDSSSTKPPPLITVRAGPAQSELFILSNGGIVVGHDGLIVAVGRESLIVDQFDSQMGDLSIPPYESELDATDCCILPGFIDGHSHPIWSGDRCHEFVMKLQGATYMDIHKMGGGINFTVERTREATTEALTKSLIQRMNTSLRFGTTTMEVKSGYGLIMKDELRLLEILNDASKRTPIEMIINYCGGHSIPKGKTESEATEDIINHQLVEIGERRRNGSLRVDLIDVFCEKGVFGVESSRRILQAGQKQGLKVNFHGDELNPLGAAEMGAEIGAIAVSHLEHITPSGMDKMAAAGTVATLLPTTAYYLRIDHAPAAEMIRRGCAVALGGDFNPNAHCQSMPFVMNLSCVAMRMSPSQTLNAATINAAASLGLGSTHGTIEVTKVADFVVIDAPLWEHIIYQLVDSPILYVVKRGAMVYRDKEKERRKKEIESIGYEHKDSDSET